MENLDLFAQDAPAQIQIGQQAFVIKGLSLPVAEQLLAEIKRMTQLAPFRQMPTPNGYQTSVAFTNCGTLGWTSNAQGYQYVATDPLTAQPWPAMPSVFLELAQQAAALAGFADYQPDSCLMNRYLVGTKLSLHQDKNEQDFSQPIVSVSLGLPARFLWGGHQRSDPTLKFLLEHGDVMVWGGVDRLRYHGVGQIRAGFHPSTGEQRINFTFRKAG